MRNNEIIAMGLDWETNEESDYEDDLNTHFADFGRWHYLEISDEALRVMNLIVGPGIEATSPLHAIAASATMQASSGALAIVAAMLGVNQQALESVVYEWGLECQDNPVPTVTPQRFMELCAEATEFFADPRRNSFGTAEAHEMG